MHDPLVVAFEIRRPWPRRRRTHAGKSFHWPAVITVWHREPGGHDSGEVCKHYIRRQNGDGTWRTEIRNGWRFHIHHWKIQCHPLQDARRRLLTRCTWCGGRHRRCDAVNHSTSCDSPRARWWRGERGLYHSDCATVSLAHVACLCEAPTLPFGGYGRCARCRKYRPYGATEEQLALWRLLAAIPAGVRDRDVYERAVGEYTVAREAA
jgi:hypothetical protein